MEQTEHGDASRVGGAGSLGGGGRQWRKGQGTAGGGGRGDAVFSESLC